MNPKLTALVSRKRGIFSRRDAIACGYTDAQIRARIRRGEWVRIWRGTYAPANTAAADLSRTANDARDTTQHQRPTGSADAGKPDDDEDADPANCELDRSLEADERAAEAHRLLTRAVLASLGRGVVASHQSAAVAHGLPAWGLDLARVHVTRSDGRLGRTRSRVVQHKATGPVARERAAGIGAVPLARAVVETATLSGFEAGVVLADAALRAGVDRDDLRRALRELGRRDGSVKAAAVVEFADGRSESVGESRLRVLMDTMGVPAPELQHTVLDDGGQFVGRVDFFFPTQGVVVEFDGLVKYREDSAATVVREKKREDALRELGHEVVRVVWRDLHTPELTALRIMRALKRGVDRRATTVS
jgi:hypothetical protein